MEEARQAALAGDYDRAARLIIDGAGFQEAAQAFNDLGRRLYNEDRNLPATRGMLERGIAFAALHDQDEEVKGRQKAMNYNLGSFCWPGWGEADRKPTSEDIEAGKRGADENLRLGEELQRPDGPMANAHWLVGAYGLVDRNWPVARTCFRRMRELTDRAGEPGMSALADGYLLLTDVLEGKQTPAALDNFCASLKAGDAEDGEFFGKQITSAYRVFSPD